MVALLKSFLSDPVTSRQQATRALIVEGTVELATRRETRWGEAKAWAEAEDAKGYVCACGCGGQVRVTPRHFKGGIPGYIRGHQFARKG